MQTKPWPLKAEERPGERGGVVLIAVLTTLLAIFALVFEVNRRAGDELENMSRVTKAAQLRVTAVSGVEIAKAILAEDGKKGGVDTVQELWADPQALEEFLATFDFGEAKLNLVITDELSKIQVNALVEYPAGKQFNPHQKGLWDRLLALLNRSEDDDLDSLGENVDIANTLKDWLDFGDGDAITGLNGAEDDYYLGLEKPYPCGNGPVRHLDELARVKGMGLELLNRSEAGYRIRDFLTVFGAELPTNKDVKGEDAITELTEAGTYTFPGRININTAELPVIFAMMPETMADIDRKIAAESIVSYRSDRDEENFINALEGDWYKSCPGCENNGIDPAMVRTDSTVFSIASQASSDEGEVTVHCVVQRDSDKLTVLSWWEGGDPPKAPGSEDLTKGIQELLGGDVFDF